VSFQQETRILKDKEVLLTGGCGFIGSEVTKQLSEIGANVTIFDNLSSGKESYISTFDNVKLIQGDIRDEDAVASVIKNKEYIINLAALPFIPDSYQYPKEFFEVNVNGTLNIVVSLLKEKNVKRFVHISSSEIYGTAQQTPMNENHPTTPHSTYAVSKLAGDRVVFTLHKEHGLPAVIIRPFNSFGPNITQPYIIPEILTQLFNNNQIKLGNIDSKRDLTFVSDTAKAMILALVTENIEGETINIGSQKAVSVKELVSLMSKMLSKSVDISIDESRLRPFDVNVLECDNTKAKNILNWSPEISLEDGLAKTIDWAKKNHIEYVDAFTGYKTPYRNSENTVNEEK
jgi:nucleoside-diphosphate-sugar epimerase